MKLTEIKAIESYLETNSDRVYNQAYKQALADGNNKNQARTQAVIAVRDHERIHPESSSDRVYNQAYKQALADGNNKNQARTQAVIAVRDHEMQS